MMIWVPNRQLILPRGWQKDPLQYMDPSIILPGRFRGQFKLDVIRSDGSVRLSTGWFDNLVTNAGLDLIGGGTGSAIIPRCHVGTGSATPAVTDTGLTTWLAQTGTVTNTTNNTNASSPYDGNYIKTYRFAAGVATGNISEVGVGPNTSNTNMFSHALIVDGGGTPTTITVLSTEALDVTYKIQHFPPTADVGGSVTLSGTTYTTNARAANCGSGWAWQEDTAGMDNFSGSPFTGTYSTQTLGAVTATPSGTRSSAPQPTNLAYSNGNYYCDAQLNFALGDGNSAGGVGSAILALGNHGHMGNMQVSFTPVIPKDSSHIMTWIVRHTFARYP